MNNEYMLFCSFLSGHLGFLEGGVFPLKKPFHYMERVVMEWVAAIRLHTDDLKI
jgi:predicted alpha/beta-fold hydrolase